MKTNKQTFTIEFIYPEMDAKVTEEELKMILFKGLKCFGWEINVKEESK